MKTIYFKNGTSVKVPQVIVNSIFTKKNLGQATNVFESFSEDSVNIDLVINVNEISHVE